MEAIKSMKIAPLGKLPEIGIVPEEMFAQVIRTERYGSPRQAFSIEKVPIPELADDELLIGVKAAGLNYNAVWASTGQPLDLIKYRQKRFGVTDDFLITGSDGAGIVYKKGSAVDRFEIGDEVVLGALQLGEDDPYTYHEEPVMSDHSIAWGFETNYGSFAQFCVVKQCQCFEKPANLSWTDAATYCLSLGTAYRMLNHYSPNNMTSDDVVLVWGACGGLGVYATQLAQLTGATVVGIVSSVEKEDYCRSQGIPCLNRNNYEHWGTLPEDLNSRDYFGWIREVEYFKKDLLALTGGREPTIVVEHPGQNTLATSLHVCSKLGMVVICAGTTGYMGNFDLRVLWMNQKRIQGSHGFSYFDLLKVNEMMAEETIKPVVSEVYSFEDIPYATQLLMDNNHGPGSIAFNIAAD